MHVPPGPRRADSLRTCLAGSRHHMGRRTATDHLPQPGISRPAVADLCARETASTFSWEAALLRSSRQSPRARGGRRCLTRSAWRQSSGTWARSFRESRSATCRWPCRHNSPQSRSDRGGRRRVARLVAPHHRLTRLTSEWRALRARGRQIVARRVPQGGKVAQACHLARFRSHVNI